MYNTIISKPFPALLENLLDSNLSKTGRTQAPVNIGENSDQIDIEMAVPGYSKELIDINLDDMNILTIVGKSPEEKSPKNKTFRRKEIHVTPFNRSFRLGKEIERTGIQASYNDGILRIMVPKIAENTKKEAMSISVK
jgi:HSP20 family protein